MAKAPSLGVVVVIALVAVRQQSSMAPGVISEPSPFFVGHLKSDIGARVVTPVLFLCAYKSRCAMKCEGKTAQRTLLLKIYITKDEQLDDGVKWWQEM